MHNYIPFTHITWGLLGAVLTLLVIVGLAAYFTGKEHGIQKAVKITLENGKMRNTIKEHGERNDTIS